MAFPNGLCCVRLLLLTPDFQLCYRAYCDFCDELPVLHLGFFCDFVNKPQYVRKHIARDIFFREILWAQQLICNHHFSCSTN